MARMGGKCCCNNKVLVIFNLIIACSCQNVDYLIPAISCGIEKLSLYIDLFEQSATFDFYISFTNRIIYGFWAGLCALREELVKIAEALSAPGKGILAADESPDSLTKRFREINLENTEIVRRDYRLMLLSADKNEISKYISGVILHHETLHQKTRNDSQYFPEFLRERNIIPGIKVDKGVVDLFGSENETTTQGLDDLLERCIDYKKKGCHFAKWRCTYRVTDTLPSRQAIEENANVLARYASICQSARLVPIVEPEVLNTGGHSLARNQQVHEEIFSAVYRAMILHRVYLEGTILKPSMITPGSDNGDSCSPELIAEATLTALARTVPCAVPGITFLSGGQGDDASTVNLNAINSFDRKKPWILTFCYGRALQMSPMKIWNGESSRAEEAQAVFLERAKACSQAALGEYKENIDCAETGPCQFPP